MAKECYKNKPGNAEASGNTHFVPTGAASEVTQLSRKRKATATPPKQSKRTKTGVEPSDSTVMQAQQSHLVQDYMKSVILSLIGIIKSFAYLGNLSYCRELIVS